MAAGAGGLLFANLPYNRKATMSARLSAAPVAHVAGVNPALSRGPGLVASLVAGVIAGGGCPEGSAQGLTVATIRYPRRGTVSMYVGCLGSSPSTRRSDATAW